MGLQVLPGACSSAGSPRGHSFLQAHLPAPVWTGLQVGICSTMDLPGLQGHSLPHHGLLHRLQGNLCSGAWSTSSPSFCADLGVCRAVPRVHSDSSLLLLYFYCRFFPPLLKCVIPEVLPPLLMGSALARGGSILGPTGIGSIGHGGSFW